MNRKRLVDLQDPAYQSPPPGEPTGAPIWIITDSPSTEQIADSAPPERNKPATARTGRV